MNRNRGWFIFMLVVAAFLTMCFSPFVRGKEKSNLVIEFEYARRDAIDLIQNHLLIHPDCDTKHLPDIIECIEIRFEYDGNENVSAWVIEGVLFINSNRFIKRSLKKNIVTFIHEALHIKGLCLDDSNISKVAICKLFGKDIYHSTDITNLIKDHLKRELNNENTISSK